MAQTDKISPWHKAGVATFGAGVLLLFYPVCLLSYFTYPILAWGILGILDALNILKWNTSLMTADTRLFWGSVVPVSLLFWLFFEFVNLSYPQWQYLNSPVNKGTATLLTVLSFSTVIPLVMEVLWYIAGPVMDFKMPAKVRDVIVRYRWFFPGLAAALLASLFARRTFWSVQVMWFIPFFLFVPFVPAAVATVSKIKHFVFSIIGAAFLSGFIWEAANYRATTKWVYLLLPHSPHLFEMPLAGYLGYVPFAFSVLAVYLWTRKQLGYNIQKACILYIFALTASYFFVVMYSGVFGA